MTTLPPAPQRTMMMPSFEPPPTQPSRLAGRGIPAAAVGSRSGRPSSRFGLAIFALLIAAVAAGITATVLNSAHPTGPAADTAPPTTAPAVHSSAPAASPSTDSPSPSASPSPTGAMTSDPAADPIGYLEMMRSQIDGFIAQGQDTIDPNTGRDLQNSIGDLENALTAARNNNSSNRQQRAVGQKINDLVQRINDDQDNGLISQDAANQLTGELQGLADALSNKAGNN